MTESDPEGARGQGCVSLMSKCWENQGLLQLCHWVTVRPWQGPEPLWPHTPSCKRRKLGEVVCPLTRRRARVTSAQEGTAP